MERQMERLIQLDRSIIPACDVETLEDLQVLARETCHVSGIGAYKVGALLAMEYGLPAVVAAMKTAGCEQPIVYDHQKAGTDIPDLGSKFARRAAKSGVQAVILFPFGGAATEREWIKACQAEGLTVLVGGQMTQPEFFVSEGGFIGDGAPALMYEIAVALGVRNFVVPGNKPEVVAYFRRLLEGLIEGDAFTLYAPGFVKQGGVISEAAKAAGSNWHGIVGSAIYEASNIRSAAEEMVSQILAE